MSLSWLSAFTVTPATASCEKDPFKQSRIAFEKLTKKFGMEKMLAILEVRMAASKLLNSILSKKKIKDKVGTAGKQAEALYQKIENCKNITEATNVLKKNVEDGTLSKQEAEDILSDVESDNADPEDDTDMEDDPLADLMDETMGEAREQAEEQDDDNEG